MLVSTKAPVQRLAGNPNRFLMSSSLLHFYCYITNYHIVSSLKQHSFITSEFCRSESQAQSVRVLSSESYKVDIKVLIGLYSFLEALGRKSLPSPTKLMEEFILLWLMSLFLCSLFVRGHLAPSGCLPLHVPIKDDLQGGCCFSFYLEGLSLY